MLGCISPIPLLIEEFTRCDTMPKCNYETTHYYAHIYVDRELSFGSLLLLLFGGYTHNKYVFSNGTCERFNLKKMLIPLNNILVVRAGHFYGEPSAYGTIC